MSRVAAKPDPSPGRVAPHIMTGADRKARELAQEAARRSGLSLADWLNQVMAGSVASTLDVGRGSEESAGDRSSETSSSNEPSRQPKTSRARPKQARGGGVAEVARLKTSLAEMMKRLEAVESRSTLIADRPAAQLDELDAAIGKVTTQTRQNQAHAELHALQAREQFRALRHRLDRLEMQPTTFDGASVHARIARLTARLDELEAASKQAVETSAVDAMVFRFMDRVEQGQNHAVGSLRALEGALIGLEQVVGKMAEATSPALGEPQAEISRQLAPGGVAERPVSEMPDVEASAHASFDPELQERSLDALDQIGAEVFRVVQDLDQRVDEVRQRSDDHVAEVGREMSRLVSAMDDRLTRAGEAQAGTLEAIGGKIAIVAEQLAGSIVASEQRSAQIMAKGLDAVGERLQRAIQQLNAHHDRAASELKELVRQRELRTAKLVAQACEQVQASTSGAVTVESFKPEASPTDPSAAPIVTDSLRPDMPASPSDVTAEPAVPTRAATLDAWGLTESPAPSPAPAPRVGANRELIEQARAAARMSAESQRRSLRKGRTEASKEEPDIQTTPPGGEDVLVLRSGLGGLLRRRYV